MFGCFVLIALFVQYCASKPVEYQGYPEENRNLNDPLLFEGDMRITPYQKQLALSGGDVSMATGKKRGASRLPIWHNGIIPYTIDPALNAYKDGIEHAMRIWENNTCIRFVPRTNHALFLDINAKPGCTSSIGFMPPPFPREMTLGPGCYKQRIYLHELGHAMGFFHEQSRPDRDNYVEIKSSNIKIGFANNFFKYSNMAIQSFGSPYDYSSIMHYGPYEFTKAEGLPTIVSKNPNVVLKLNEVLSASDVEQANNLYGCPTSLPV